jgi:precorrin-3B methylase
MTNMSTGSLTIVGTGIRLSQVSTEARAHIEGADQLLFLVCDPVTYTWLTQVNSKAESLHTYYGAQKPREQSYLEMVERILSCVRNGSKVCVALYGHPGVFAYPGHEAIRRARSEGYIARMVPGISAEDCLFADVGIDPSTNGCQSFEATDFLVSRRRFDPRSALILWQTAVTGDLGYRSQCNIRGLRVLVDYLLQYYDKTQEVIIYEGSCYFGFEPRIQRVALEAVPEARVTVKSTLLPPPKESVTPDLAMADRLGIPLSYFENS